MTLTTAKSRDKSIVQWKEAFLSKPSISIRKGISHGYEPAFENTSTLVLTSPSGQFVDIRFPRQMSYTHSGQQLPLSAHSAFWAFSGMSETTFYDHRDDLRPGLPFAAHTIFHHDIDSKGPGIVDEGDCFILPSGDIVEVGILHETKQMYKEIWTSPELLPGRTSVPKLPIAVAETVKAVNGRGLIIRVGDYVQGIYEFKDVSGKQAKTLVHRTRRATYSELDEQDARSLQQMGFGKTGDDTEQHIEIWISDTRGNAKDNDHLPCSMFLSSLKKIHRGMEFESGGDRWKVVEVDKGVLPPNASDSEIYEV